MAGGHKKGVDPRAQLFVDNYLCSGNAKKSAEEAGYPESVCKAASVLLANKWINAEIKRRQAPIRERYAVTADKIIGEIAKVAFSNIDDFCDIDQDGTPRINFNKSTPESRAAISEITQEMYTECSTEVDRECTTEPGEWEEKRNQIKRTKIKLHSKLQALEYLGKHLNIFGDKHTPELERDVLAQQLRTFLASTLEADGLKLAITDKLLKDLPSGGA